MDGWMEKMRVSKTFALLHILKILQAVLKSLICYYINRMSKQEAYSLAPTRLQNLNDSRLHLHELIISCSSGRISLPPSSDDDNLISIKVDCIWIAH